MTGLSTLLDDSAPSASVDGLKAPLAPTHPKAQPGRLGSVPSFQELASGRPRVEDVPLATTRWERLLVGSGLSTNVLFPALVVLLILGSLGGLSEVRASGTLVHPGAAASALPGPRTPFPAPARPQVVSALAAKARGEDVGLLLPMLSAVVASASLAVVGYGLSVAPDPQQQEQPPAGQS